VAVSLSFPQSYIFGVSLSFPETAEIRKLWDYMQLPLLRELPILLLLPFWRLQQYPEKHLWYSQDFLRKA